MNKIRLILCLMLLVFAGTLMTGCTEYVQVPNGSVAKKSTDSGLEPKIYGTGSVNIWAIRDKNRLVCLETAQYSHTLNDQILCQDQMNLPFTVEARFGIRTDDDAAMNTAFVDLSPDRELATKVAQITSKRWFSNYAKSPLLATAKGVLSRYETMEIGMVREVYPLNESGAPDSTSAPQLIGVSREILNAALKSDLDKALRGTPVVCFFAAFTNFDYPDVVTDAIEQAKRVEVEIQEEANEQAKRLLVKQNQEELAMYDYRIEVLDALKVADSNKIIGESVSLGYLWYLQTKVLGQAAEGPNNWGFIPYTAFESQAGSGLVNAKMMTQELSKGLTGGVNMTPSKTARDIAKQRPEVKLEGSN